MSKSFRYLLVQIRDPDDPVRLQEIGCFAKALECSEDQITPLDLLTERVSRDRLAGFHMAMIGGSGKYSVVSNADWLRQALGDLVNLVDCEIPTFASCWGFQALARACGGKVIHNLQDAELGTLPITKTVAGTKDALFTSLPETFLGYMGHEDHVVQLPENCTLLASTEKVAHQAFRFDGKPIYCTQFHPELTLDTLLRRIEAYPEYCERIAKIPFNQFRESCHQAPESETLLMRFRNLFVS